MNFRLGLMVAIMITGAASAVHNQNTEQWKNLQSALCFSADEMEMIRAKVGHLSLQRLVNFRGAIDRLLAQQVSPSDLLPSDALQADPKHHKLIAENTYFRTLWATIAVGEKSNFHTHQWPNVLLVTSEPTIGITHYQNGRSIKEEWDLEIEESQAGRKSLAFTNCGPHDFKGLVVELKQTLPATSFEGHTSPSH